MLVEMIGWELEEPVCASPPFYPPAQWLEMLHRMDVPPARRLVWRDMEQGSRGQPWIWGVLVTLLVMTDPAYYLEIWNNKRNNWKGLKQSALRTAEWGQVGEETVPFHFKPYTSIWFFFFFVMVIVTTEHLSQESGIMCKWKFKSKWLREKRYCLFLSSS